MADTFKVYVKERFQNVEHIHPLQQEKVAAMVKEFSADPNILKLIIFGSSVTKQCRVGSDVDFYVIPENAQLLKHKHYGFDFVYDRWTPDMVNERFLNEILSTGVVVYEKK